MTFAFRIVPVVLCVLATAWLSGCGRTSVTFALGPDDGKLQETVVIDEGGGPKVAQIDVRGLILDGARPALLSDGQNPVDELTARLEKAAKDSEVRAIVLRINSPGGGVAATESMYSEVRRFRESTGKPVVVSMSEVAASGGYYLALAGDEIIAQSSTITGSIGVIIPSVNISEAMNRWGIKSRSVVSGVNKDIANPLEPMRDSQYAVLQGIVDEFYASFRSRVLERRAGKGEVASRADELMDGRVMTGAAAVRVGLADSEGGVRDAFARAKALASLGSARLVKYHSEGAHPRSAYALSESQGAAGAGGRTSGDINLLKLELPQAMLGLGGLSSGESAGAYYLWMP